MKWLAALLLLWLFAEPAREAAIPYFTHVRNVKVAAPDHQNYIVVDDQIWTHSARALADLRLYQGEQQVPYVILRRSASSTQEEQKARILNLGMAAGHAEFDVDVGEVPEYDHVRLFLTTKNFVVKAGVEGKNALDEKRKTELGSSTLYDFSRENLGSNLVLKLPTSSFRYLHVRLAPGIHADEIKGASIFNLQEKKASWVNAGGCDLAGQQNRETRFACDVPQQVPLDRIAFELVSSQQNFRRDVRVLDSTGGQFAMGEISRVHITRGHSPVTSQDLDVDVVGPHSAKFTVVIENGDNAPLKITAVRPLSIERRLYFDPQGKTSFKLYYGDDKLAPPVYDYAKFFEEDAGAARAEVGASTRNPAYAGRPDERPWSERHKAILWITMLAAVAVLAVLAVRGMKAGAPPT
jgi:Protein of unknown function (DUF3999)